jgi:predicted ATPase
MPASARLSSSERDRLVALAEGNPLYLEELLHSSATLPEDARDGVLGSTVPGRRISLPTLDALLVERLDRLSREARRVVGVAAVIGRTFSLDVLEQAAGTQDTEPAVAELLRRDFIREHRYYPRREYVFRHGLLRKAAVSTLTPSRRMKLYGEVARTVERMFADALDEHLEVIAHYYARSNVPEKALEYLERAADRAAALDATEHANALRERAREVARHLGDDS